MAGLDHVFGELSISQLRFDGWGAATLEVVAFLGRAEGSNRCGRMMRRWVFSPFCRDIASVLSSRSWPASREPVPGDSGTDAQAERRHQWTEGVSATGQETRGEGTILLSGFDASQHPGRVQVDSPPAVMLKYHSLIDKVYDWDNLVRAWRKVRANKGAHGLDRVTIQMFESDWETHLREIQRKLVQHRYEPQPVRRVYIPKASDPKKLRPLGIPVVADRIVQQAMVLVLDPLFDGTMSERSYGFRNKRKAHDAIAAVIRDLRDGYHHVVDADIQAFFDRIVHTVVMSRVRSRIADGGVLDLIEGFLKAGIYESGVVTAPSEGTPQGGVISPWLSNLVLDDLDKALEAAGYRHVRYADDFIVLCRSPKEASLALEVVRAALAQLKLTLHPTKTRISSLGKGFEFLGFHFRNYHLGVRSASIGRFKDRVRKLTRRQQGRNVEAVIKDLNAVIRGWARYVGVAEVVGTFRTLDRWIRMRIRSFRFQRKKANDNARIPNRRLRRWGLFSLAQCRPELRLQYICASAPRAGVAPCKEVPTRGRPVAVTLHAVQ